MTSVEEICDNITLLNKSKKILEGDITSIRNKYSHNIYDIEFSELYNTTELTSTADYKIILPDNDDKGKIKLELLNNDISNNDLLTIMMSIGSIKTFKKHLSSMNDIFINLVENNE
jgi:ABC-2 type transport system ATP-binding protein